MKKFLIAAVAAVLLTTGSASADSGFWSGGDSSSWFTFVAVHNGNATSTAITATFYSMSGVAIGSTTQTIAANGEWFFNTSAVGTIPSNSFETGSTTGTNRGVVVFSPNSATGNVHAYTTVFKGTYNSGFNYKNQF